MIDLQAYLDGSLPEAERAAIEAQLKTDGALAAELDGLRALKGAIRESVLADAAPLDRLASKLSIVAKPRIPRWLTIAAPATLAAAAAAAALLLFAGQNDPMRLDRTPQVAAESVSDAKAASKWLTGEVGFAVPAIQLPAAPLIQASYGEGWARYGYRSTNASLSLTMSRDASPLATGVVFTDEDGHHMRIGKGVGWSHKGIAYYLTGGDESLRKHLACEACKQCGGTDVDCGGASFAVRDPDIFDLDRVPAKLAVVAPRRTDPGLLQVADARRH